MSYDAIRHIFLKEIRAWRYRFWWLPIAGALVVIVPMAFSSPPSLPTPQQLQQQQWRWQQIIFSTIPAAPFAGVVLCFGLGTMLLALWMGRTLRWSEVHDDTIIDLALSPLTALEVAAGQVLAAWVVTTVALAGAAPVFVFYGTMAGRTAADMLPALLVLLMCPLFAAAVGYGMMWWKRLALEAMHGRSFRRFLLWFVPLLAAMCVGLGWPLADPAIRSAASTPQPDPMLRLAIVFVSLVWGLPLLCAVWLAIIGADALRRRVLRLRGHPLRWKVALLLLGLFVISSVRMETGRLAFHGFIPVSMFWNRLATDWSSWLNRFSNTPMLSLWWGLLSFVFGLAPLGASCALGGQWGSTQTTNMVDPFVQPSLAVGLGYWAAVGMTSFVFATRDLAWTMKNSWAIGALQNPARAALLAPEAARAPHRREFLYPFITRNPVYDLCLARSMGTRSALVVVFGFVVLGSAAWLAYDYSAWATAPFEQWRFEAQFSLPFMVALLLSSCCGLGCGLTIARLKRQQQWSALLPTPLPFRALLVGVCLPRWVDGLTLTVLLYSVNSIGLPLRMLRELEMLWATPLAMITVLLVCTATSLFGSAFTKSPAKTGFLGVLLAILLCIGFGMLLSWVEQRFFPMHEGPRSRWENWTPMIVAFIALALASVTLTGLACRRLRWDR